LVTHLQINKMRIDAKALLLLSFAGYVAPSVITTQISSNPSPQARGLKLGVVRFVNYENGEALASFDSSEGSKIITRYAVSIPGSHLH
ncbi:MAG: hypothetical protein LQ344_003183, partial [Seirophora lacunosa]